MSLFFNLREGSWQIWSESDPRWNRSGRSDGVGLFTMPLEAKDAIEKLKAKLGEPPEDLNWSYMKD